MKKNLFYCTTATTEWKEGREEVRAASCSGRLFFRGFNTRLTACLGFGYVGPGPGRGI